MKELKQYIRKADIILFVFLVAAGLAVSAALALSQTDAGSGSMVIIDSGGSRFGEYPLSEDAEIEVPAPAGGLIKSSEHDDYGEAAAASKDAGSDSSESVPAAGNDIEASDSSEKGGTGDCLQHQNYNIVKISGGRVFVSEASCKNQVCVKHGAISKAGESIVCLPNRLVVRIDAGSPEKGGGYDSVTS